MRPNIKKYKKRQKPLSQLFYQHFLCKSEIVAGDDMQSTKTKSLEAT